MADSNLWHTFKNLPLGIKIFGWLLLFPLVFTLAVTRGQVRPFWRLAAGLSVFVVSGTFWVALFTSGMGDDAQHEQSTTAVQAGETEPAPPFDDVSSPSGSDVSAAHDAAANIPSAEEADSSQPNAGDPNQPRAPPESTEGELVASLLAELVVAAEKPAGYDRNLFPHWITREGCNTRQTVLIRDVQDGLTVNDRCVVQTGLWYSPFDDVWVDNPRAIDIDHLVPLAEAWRSGAHSWDNATRRAFANDLDDSRSLIAVTASSNRSKGDRDPANWLPPNQSYRCTYVGKWVAVKHRWALTVDSQEHAAIRRVLDNCGPLRTTAQSTTPPPHSARPAVPPAPNGNTEGSDATNTCIDVNTASHDELQQIVHISTVRATDLIRLRPFANLDDLTRISGIGPARLTDIRQQGKACVSP